MLPSSRFPGVCPGGGMVLDEIDTCINRDTLPLTVLIEVDFLTSPVCRPTSIMTSFGKKADID